MSSSSLLQVRVWGEFACFTRPEMKVERVSYPCLTPSAARGILEAIFWKPEFTWRVRSIGVLSPIRYFSLLRNEVTKKASARSAKGGAVIVADDDGTRSQRHTLALRNVDYLISADVELRDHSRDENPAKYRDQFRRRVASGRCFRQPYLGCREFSAFFAEPTGEVPLSLDLEIGPMLLDIEFPHGSGGPGRPVFFEARLDHGVLEVPLTGTAAGGGQS